jgi:Na+-driven multidrug efflux pump
MLGVAGFWWGLVAGLVVAAVVLLARLVWLTGDERTIERFALR